MATLGFASALRAQREPVQKPTRIDRPIRIDSAPKPPTVTIYPPGKYRISISGFVVNHETEDDLLQRDGKGDEVYFSAQILKTENGALSSNPLTSRLIQSPVYGDRNGFPDRIAAGSRSDQGGLQTGDRFQLPAPFVLWEGPISGGLLVTPTIWEWDGNSLDQRRLELAWQARMKPFGGTILGQFSKSGGPYSFGSYPTVRVAGYQELTNYPCNGCFISEYTDYPICGIICPDPLGVNRPVGVNKPSGSGFLPAAIRLGAGNLEAALAGKNVLELPIQYQDYKKGGGDYTISLRLERIP
ncbi:MAG: hypothetical protein ACR2OG_07235 [Gemmatimonadaceae bacterium]